MENHDLLTDLQCPISLSLLEDPITVPCCGKAFSRLSLVQCMASKPDCPMCNTNLEYLNFDPLTATKNVVLSGLIETLKNSSINTDSVEEEIIIDGQEWACSLAPIYGKDKKLLSVAELNLSLTKAEFVTRPSLFITVVDKSGSMGGNPWNQVQAALLHIMSLSRNNSSVKTIIITYDSSARIVNTSGTEADVNRIIKTMSAGGGTNFSAAFDKIKEVLDTYICSDDKELQNAPNNISNVIVSFLTDGQAGGNTVQLATDFKQLLNSIWPTTKSPLSVHSIGFGRSCDKAFLENLRKAGSTDGTFRYAEPQDDGDSLCFKLQSLFEVASKASSVPIHMKIVAAAGQEYTNFVFKNSDTRVASDEYTSELNINYPIDRYKTGLFQQWIYLLGDTNPIIGLDLGSVIINSHLDDNLTIPIVLATLGDNEDKDDMNNLIFDKLMSSMIDEMASELLELSKDTSYSKDTMFLHLDLILQRIDAMVGSTNDQILIDRLEYLALEIDSIKSGNSVNIGKLGDMRFASQFGTMIPSNKPKTSTQIKIAQKLTISNKPRWTERYVTYNRNNIDKGRNVLQEAIANNEFNRLTPEIEESLAASCLSDMVHTDTNGNTVLMLACFFGQSMTVEKILEKYPDLDMSIENNDKETAMTLAIKKRGFWKVMKILLKAGAVIPEKRVKGLEEYAINHGFVLTGKIIGSIGESPNTVNDTMTPDYIKFLYERAIDENVTIDNESYLDTALTKCMFDLAKTVIYKHGAEPTVNMLMDYCIPKKADDPETPKYIKLAELLLTYNGDLINCSNDSGDTPLIRAAEKGSLPHVKLFIEMGATIDSQNNLGNTALWIACNKRYPCIITELLDNGANINHLNQKGNVPMYSVCQMGPLKVAEQLLSRGAEVDQINANGDTLVLLCCRNGQHDILKLFLDYVEPELVDLKAHIDGFNAIFASVEANRPECIKVLYDYGIDLNQKTDTNNPILPGASPLHLAAYYNRLPAIKELIALGANIDSLDVNNQTPLHLAVIQGNIPIIKVLVNSGANVCCQDNFGNTPTSYCRNNKDIQKLLVNPALESLMRLARGQFQENDVKHASTIIMKYAGTVGCLSQKDAIDVVDHDGSTPLLVAIIHSNYNVVKLFLNLGADPTIGNMFGVNSYVWANHIRNPRIKKLLPPMSNSGVENDYKECMARLHAHPKEAHILFLGPSATNCENMGPAVTSGISSRMETFINSVTLPTVTHDTSDTQTKTNQKDYVPFNPMAIAIIGESKSNVDDKAILEIMIWYSKVFTINMIASGKCLMNTPSDVLIVSMFTSNAILAQVINKRLMANSLGTLEPFVNGFNNVLDSLPSFDGEVFMGANNVDRVNFAIGNTISWPTFVSATTLWRVAIDHVTDYSSKKKQGTVFIVKSKTGTFVGTYSQFSYDAEVIFKPNTKFKVTRWYRGGDFIVLGQENIREHTYGIKPEDIDQYLISDKSLVIEIEEF